MSLYDRSAEIEDVFRNGPIEYGRIVDIYLDAGTRHFWDGFHDITVDDGLIDGPINYIPLGDRIIPPDETTSDQSLDDGAIDIEFDSSRAADTSDPIGAMVQENLIQRRVRIRSVLFRRGTNKTVPIFLFDTQNGVIDQTPDNIGVSSQSRLNFRIASGTFAYLERLNINYSHTDQAALYAGDTGLDKIAALIDVNLPWNGEFR